MDTRRDQAVVERLLHQPHLQSTLNDPTTFFEVLQATGHCLEEPALRERADRLLGMLIAQQAPHFLSTAWPVLFQRLRDSSNVTVKLCIIRQFSNICGRLGPAERKSAFHIFSEEADKLFADVQVVTDNSFVDNLTTIIKACARHADRGFCVNLFTTILNRIATWDRRDALRACCDVACLFPIYSATCGTVADNLQHAKETLPVDKYALLLECTTRALMDHRNELGNAATTTKWRDTLWHHARHLLCGVIFSDPPLFAAIPPAVASYTRLKTAFPTLAHVGEQHNDYDGNIGRRVLSLLAQPTLKRIVVPALLELLKGIDPPRTNDQNSDNDGAYSNAYQTDTKLLWAYTQRDDPLVRSAAMEVVAKWLTDSHHARAGVTTTEDLSFDRLHELLDQYAEMRCTYTVNALIRLFAARIRCQPLCDSRDRNNSVRRDDGTEPWRDTSEGINARCIATTLYVVNSVVEKYFLFHEQVRANASVQVALLEFIDAAPVVTPHMVRFIFNALCHVEAEAVQACARSCVLSLIYLVPLNESTFRPATLTRSGVMENVAMDADWAPLRKCLLNSMQMRDNLSGVLSLIKAQFFATGENEVSREKAVGRLASTVQFLVAHYVSHFLVCDNNRNTRIIVALMDMALCLEELVFSDENLPVDILSTLMHTCSQCFTAISKATGDQIGGDYFLFQRLTSRSWNILQRCCSYLDATSAPKLHTVENVFFGFEELSSNLEYAISAASEVALTNAKKYCGSSLCVLIQSAAELFTVCIRQASAFPLFTDNLLYLHPIVITSLRALTAFDPESVLRIFAAFADICVRSSAKWSTDLVETTRRRRDAIQSARNVLLRCLTFDLQESAAAAVACLCVAPPDGCGDTHDTWLPFSLFYADVDADLSVFQAFKEVALNSQYYTHVYGTSVVEPVLRFIAFVAPHLQNQNLGIDEILSRDEMNEIQRMLVDFLQDEASALSQCRMHLERIELQLFSHDTARAQHISENIPQNEMRMLVALLDEEDLSAKKFFTALEELVDIYDCATVVARDELINVLTQRQKVSLQRLACAAALDARYIAAAVSHSRADAHAPAYLVDFLAVLSPDDFYSVSSQQCGRLQIENDYPPHTVGEPREYEEVSLLSAAATLPLPFLQIIASTEPSALISAIINGRVTAAEIFQWLFRTAGSVVTAVTTLCEHGLLQSTIDACTIIQLARCVYTSLRGNSPNVPKEVGSRVLAHVRDVVANVEWRTGLFDYSVVVVASWLLRGLWGDALDAVIAAALADSTDTEKINVVDVSNFFFIVKTCLNVPTAFSNSAVVKIIAEQTVQIISGAFGAVHSAIVLSLWQLFRAAVWSVMIERYDDDADHLELLIFATAASQFGCMNEIALREINARFTPLLLSAFKGDGDQEMQNMNLLLTAVTPFIFCRRLPQEAGDTFFPHCGFSHALRDYECTALRRRCPQDAQCASRFIESQLVEPAAAQRLTHAHEHFLNIHTRHLQPPLVCSPTAVRKQPDRLTDDDVLLQNSFLRVYVRSVSQAFRHMHQIPPCAVSTLFSTLSFLIAHGVFSDRYAWPPSVRQELRGAVADWAGVLSLISPWFAKEGVSQTNVLRSHVALFPDSYRPLPFYDAQAVLSAASVFFSVLAAGESGHASTRSELLQLTQSNIIQKMLGTDVMTYILVLLSASSAASSHSSTKRPPSCTPSSPSTSSPEAGRKEEIQNPVSVSTLLTQRLSNDLLTISESGPLGLSFCVRALLHTTIHLATSKGAKGEPLEKVRELTKLTEAAFGGTLHESARSFMMYYANYTLQCVLSVSKAGEPQWETIRILLTDALTTTTANSSKHIDVAQVDPEMFCYPSSSWTYHTFPVTQKCTASVSVSLDASNRQVGSRMCSQCLYYRQYEKEWRALASLSSTLMFAVFNVQSSANASQMIANVQNAAMTDQSACTNFFLASQIVALSRLSGKAMLQFALGHDGSSQRSRLCLVQSMGHLARCFVPPSDASSDKSDNPINARDSVLMQNLTALLTRLSADAWPDEQRCGWTIAVVLATLVACSVSTLHHHNMVLLKSLLCYTGREVELARLLLLFLSRTQDSTFGIAMALLAKVHEEFSQKEEWSTAGIRRVFDGIHFSSFST